MRRQASTALVAARHLFRQGHYRTLRAMQVTFGEPGLTKTWQAAFPPTTKCLRCGGEARIGFVAHEGSHEMRYLRDLHPNDGKGGYWLHDACAVAVYFCRDCLEPTALYNQA